MSSTWMHLWGGLIGTVVVVMGCGSTGREPASELVYLHVGVDPDEEARAVIHQLERADWSLRQRIDDRDFVALGFGRDEERAVRVVTRRGLMLALPSIGTEADRRRFIFDDVGTGADLDGDHSADIAIGELHPGGRVCLTLHRVDQSRLQTIPATVEGWHPPPCVEGVRDVAGGPTLEALAVVRFPSLAVGEAPSIVVPLEYRDGRFVELEPAPLASHIETERARRNRELQAGQLDAADVYRRSIELAALAALAGEATTRQLEELDRALRSISSLPPTLTERASMARAFIESGWGRPAELDPHTPPASDAVEREGNGESQ